MPYIGRNHIAGDHTSNFKVLDDISSHTATFNGSSASIISTADNTIRIPEHRFIQGQRVTYSNGGGGNTILQVYWDRKYSVQFYWYRKFYRNPYKILLKAF